MKIIPAIDIIEGKCVRLTKGDYNTTRVYNENPSEVARRFQDHGVQYLHVVDLEGAKGGQPLNLKTVEKIASETNLVIDFGGGLKSTQSVTDAFNAGVSKITAGSIAVKNQELVTSWMDKWGADKIILGADIRQGFISISGWTESSKLTWKDFIGDYLKAGIVEVISTDISRDGMLEGPSVDLYGEMLTAFPALSIIASGGVSSVKDVEALGEMEMSGVIIGKAIYEGRISLPQLENLVAQC